MTPAAKDPNSFASSNLSGGNSATGAILGIPQDPAAPRGPQPTAIPQGMPGGVPNFFASASGGQAPQPQVPQVPGGDQFDATHAQNQAVIAQMFQPKAPTEPTYGLGPNGELQVGDQVVPMQDNPTMAANLIQTAGSQPTQLKPGFTPVRASEINSYLANLNRSTWDATKEVGKQFAGGVVAGGLDTAGRAAQWAGADNAGQGLINAGKSADQFLGTDQPADTWNRGTLAKGFINNARPVGLALPVAGANLGLTAAGMPGAAAALDIAVVAPLFGAADAQSTQERVLQAGGSPEDAQKAGWEQFFVSGGTQAALGAVGGKLMAGGGYTLVTKLKQAVTGGAMTAEQAAQVVTNPAMLKRFAANEGINMGAQSAGMAGQSAGSAAIYNANTPDSAQKENVGEAALGGAGAGLYMGAMMAPMSAYHQWGDSGRRADMGRALNTPTEQVDLLDALRQQKTANSMVPEVGSLTSKPQAQEWAKGVGEKAFNTADGNQFAADTRSQQAAQDAYDAAQVPTAVPGQAAATKTPTAAGKPIEDPARTPHIDTLLNAINPELLTNAKARNIADQMVASGLSSDPMGDKVLEALGIGKLKQADAYLRIALNKLKGANDSTLGSARTGDGAVDTAGGAKPAGSVGAGVPEPVAPGGGNRAGAGAPAVSVQPPVVDGSAGVRPAPVVPRDATGHENTGKLAPVETPKPALPALPTHGVRAEIPDFSLEHTPATPHAAWAAAHPTEAPVEHAPTDNLSLKTQKETGQKPLFEPEVKRPTPKRPLNLPKDVAARAAVNQGSSLGPTHANPVEAAETASKAKQSRKRQEVDTAAEEAKPVEQRQAEEAARKAENLPPTDIWKAAFTDSKGNTKPGEVIGHLMAGKTAEETAKLSGVSKATVEKALKRYGSLDAFDIAEQDGKLKGFDPEDVAAARRALEKAHEGAVVRKTAAEGGAHTDDMGDSEKADLINQEGTQIRSGDEATGFSDKELPLMGDIDKFQKGIKQAKAEGDTATVERLQNEL
jgi:hypothetical protein